MRDILFKAKRIDNGEWVEGIPIKTHIGLFMCFDENPHYCNQYGYMEIDKIIKVDESTLCQYTGLTDKNGNKIWENDVLRVLLVGGTGMAKENCIVRYGRKVENFKIDLGFNLEWTKTDYLRCDICFWIENREVEVIGKTIDNPELIGE